MKIKKYAPFLAFFSLLTSCVTNQNQEINANSQENTTTTETLNAFSPHTVDGILAKVGNETILLSDLNSALMSFSQNQAYLEANGHIKGEHLKKEQVEGLYNALIEQKILEIKAKELGISLDEEELTARISDFLTNQNLTEADLNAQLEKSGKSMEDYRSDFRREVVKQMLIGRVISPFVTVTPDEVNAYYLQMTKNVQQIKTVKLRSLNITIPDNYTESISEIPAVKMVTDELKKGANFIELVEKYSTSQDAKTNKGLLPPRPLSELPPSLQSQLSNLNIDQVVGPLTIGQSVFFFQYLGADFSTSGELASNYETWKNKLLNIKFSERLSLYLKKEKSNIKIVQRPFNMDDSTHITE